MSTAPAVIRALVALYQAAFPDVQVIAGPATSTTIKAQKVITVGGTITGTTANDSMGNGTAEMPYAVEVIFSVSYPAGDMMTAVDDADAMWVAGEHAVREHPTGDLGVAGVLSAKPQGQFDLNLYADEITRSAAYRSLVMVWAQLT